MAAAHNGRLALGGKSPITLLSLLRTRRPLFHEKHIGGTAEAVPFPIAFLTSKPSAGASVPQMTFYSFGRTIPFCDWYLPLRSA